MRNSCEASASIRAGADNAAKQEKRSCDLSVHCEPATLPLENEHLVSAVAELVLNAFRFSKPGQAVTVTGKKKDGLYRIEIVDQGVGMTADQCANAVAFKQFGRDRHDQQGLGLGLAIARAAADIGGGRLTLKPGPDARGLVATLELPCG